VIFGYMVNFLFQFVKNVSAKWPKPEMKPDWMSFTLVKRFVGLAPGLGLRRVGKDLECGSTLALLQQNTLCRSLIKAIS
jgi:hypothetical protein